MAGGGPVAERVRVADPRLVRRVRPDDPGIERRVERRVVALSGARAPEEARHTDARIIAEQVFRDHATVEPER